MLAVTGKVRILLVAAAFIVLRSMTLPVTKANPTEVVPARAALHMVATSIFFYANLAFWAVLVINNKYFCTK